MAHRDERELPEKRPGGDGPDDRPVDLGPRGPVLPLGLARAVHDEEHLSADVPLLEHNLPVEKHVRGDAQGQLREEGLLEAAQQRHGVERGAVEVQRDRLVELRRGSRSQSSPLLAGETSPLSAAKNTATDDASRTANLFRQLRQLRHAARSRVRRRPHELVVGVDPVLQVRGELEVLRCVHVELGFLPVPALMGVCVRRQSRRVGARAAGGGEKGARLAAARSKFWITTAMFPTMTACMNPPNMMQKATYMCSSGV